MTRILRAFIFEFAELMKDATSSAQRELIFGQYPGSADGLIG